MNQQETTVPAPEEGARRPGSALQQIEPTVEDPLAMFFARWGWQILSLVGAAVALWLIVSVYRSTQQEARAVTGDSFVRVQQAFEELQKNSMAIGAFTAEDLKNEAKQKELEGIKSARDEQRRKLEAMLAALADGGAPYGRLASTYRALVAYEFGEREKFERELDMKGWEVAEATPETKMMSELETFLYARSLLDVEGGLPKAKEVLLSLAKRGHYVRSAAAVMVARFAESASDRDEALSVLNGVIDANPEQRELLEDELSRLQQ